MAGDLREGLAMAAFGWLSLRRKLHVMTAMRNDAPAVRAAYAVTRGVRALTILVYPARRRRLPADGFVPITTDDIRRRYFALLARERAI